MEYGTPLAKYACFAESRIWLPRPLGRGRGALRLLILNLHNPHADTVSLLKQTYCMFSCLRKHEMVARRCDKRGGVAIGTVEFSARATHNRATQIDTTQGWWSPNANGDGDDTWMK
jgi:hypothetical protein